MANDVLLATDLHIHNHKKSTDRLQDCIKVLRWIFDTAIERDIKSVIFNGDLFHDRTKIEILTMCRVFEVFDEYFGKRPPFDLYLLLGNHDMWHRDKWDVHSPAFLKAFNGVHVIDKPCSIEIQGSAVDFLPFTENPIHDLANLKSQARRGKNDKSMLCSHLAIDGAKLNSFTEADVVVEHDGDMVKVDQEFLNGWDQVYLGHYHGEQVLGDQGQVEYIGSPLELTKSEAYQEKHIIVHDLDTFQKTYIVNTFSPKHLVLKPDQLNRQDLSNHFITVVYPPVTSQAELAEIRHEILKNNSVGSLEIKPEKKRRDNSQDQKAVMDAKLVLESQDEMLKRYVDECSAEEKEGLLLDVLIQIGSRVIQTDASNEESLAATKAALNPTLLKLR